MRLPTPGPRLLAAALLFGAAELQAQSFTLTFGEPALAGNSTGIPATYGTVANLAITNRARNTFGAGTVNGGLCHWLAGYGDLTDVAYTCSSVAGVGEFTLTPVAGYQVTLHSFDVGEYQGRVAGNAEVRVYGLDLGAPALFTATQALGAAGHWSLAPELTTTSGFNLQWGDNWDYGIDNISLTVAPIAASAVPEPATVTLLGAGLVALGAGARRRRSGVAQPS
jgi:hypothetical protein